ncbi:MAG: hypothetical protein WC637_00145 [Victivallales bacterium]|jgi:hypothetical protein
MENEVMVYDDNVPAIADDSLLRIAEMAERRIDAVVKIKQMALKVTNANDWNDQGGKPYLQVSGSEKVANLFNISWRIDEPVVDTEDDGHFTFTFRGIFSIPGRSISAEGSRSSKDPFFKKYDWIKEQGKADKKVEKPISAIDRRDVRMAALTNLLGNGITRLLGIRNLSYADLDLYAGIKKEMIGVVDYKGKGKDREPLKEPQKKAENGKTESAALTVDITITEITHKDGETKGKPWRAYYVQGDNGEKYGTFSETDADIATGIMSKGVKARITYTVGKYGNNLTGIEEAAA